MFIDRIDAGLQLAERLKEYKDKEVVVLAIPRGGLPLGAIIAKSLNAPLDVALSKKIGDPYNKEYAIGAVTLENIILSDAAKVDKEYLEKETVHIREKLRIRHDQYYKNKKPESLKGKVVIIVDDGIATGNTILVTAELIHSKHPKKTIVAIPVAPRSSITMLEASLYIDMVICLDTPFNFHAVGQFYKNFHQISDEEAIAILGESTQPP
ncbi:phosphoribosyltransferase [Sediminicola arcticus]|jgi:putative phosphoribosyl transferase|uniref:Phosphoribosyltransferase family protein n=1 Tax=Sediminicola arcticus TaxID=1574308 RepID=A0ABV2SS08_9FLAO